MGFDANPPRKAGERPCRQAKLEQAVAAAVFGVQANSCSSAALTASRGLAVRASSVSARKRLSAWEASA